MRKGLTLLEIILSVAIFVLVATSISIIFRQSLSVYRASNDRTEAAQEAQNAMEWIVRDIQSSQSISVAQGNNITMAKDTNTISYALNGTQIDRQENTVTNLLAEGVTGFSLAYYDINNATVPPSPIANIRTVEIDIIIQRYNEQFRLYTVAGLD